MTHRLVIAYADEKTDVYHNIKRPMVSVSIYSRRLKCWINIENMLADTGADISILPRNLGILMVGDYKKSPGLKSADCRSNLSIRCIFKG